jgi:integrase
MTESRTRRGNRESWIGGTPNARGYYEGSVWMGTKANGRPDRRHVERKTLASVRRGVRELERKRDAGAVGKPGRVATVEEMLTRHLTVVLPQRGRAPRTIADYESKCRNDIFPRWGGQKIDRLLPEQIEDGYAEMLAAGHKPSHVRKVHAILSSAYEIEVKRGNVARNPCKLVDPPEIGDPDRSSLTRTQVAAVLETARSRRNQARWSIGLACGLRQGEALGIRWEYLIARCTECDRTAPAVETWARRKTPACPVCKAPYVVELRAWHQLQRLTWQHGCKDPHACGAKFHKVKPCPEGCRMHTRACPPPCKPDCTDHARHCPKRALPAGLVAVSGGLVLRPIKEKRKKTVPLPPELAVMLRAHHADQAAEKLAAGELWEEHDLVFCGVDGKPIDPRDDWEEWAAILKAAGVPHHGVHSQRHTAATVLIDEGIALTVVQEMLGHSDIRITRGYVHTASPVARDAAARMGAALFGKGARNGSATKTAPKRSASRS